MGRTRTGLPRGSVTGMRRALTAVVLLALLPGCTGDGLAQQQSPSAPPGRSATATTASPPASIPATTSPASTPSARASTPTPTPGVRDSSLDLPLIEAAGRGDRSEVRRLLERGASVRATDQRGRTPLIAAAYGNHVRVARELLRAGADPDEKDATVQSAYLIATSEVGDDPALLELLLAAGADVAARDSFNGTGLIRAAERGFPDIVAVLLAAGVEVDHVNRLGWTALHEAIILGDGSRPYVEVVRLLVDAGADVDLPSARDGVRPLTHARRAGQEQVAQALEEAGARP